MLTGGRLPCCRGIILLETTAQNAIPANTAEDKLPLIVKFGQYCDCRLLLSGKQLTNGGKECSKAVARVNARATMEEEME
jgi:hypothetical protein